MIDFKNPTLLKLRKANGTFDNEVTPLLIEGENISYTTNKESIEVTAELTDNLADYDLNGFESLMIGYNVCSILVTAEEGI